MASTDGPQRRELRDFDYEAELRQRRLFILLMVGFAILAILAGIIVALWILPDPHVDDIPPLPRKEAEEVAEIEDVEEIPDDPIERGPRGVALKLTLDASDITKGIRRIQGALNRCSQTHGALDLTNVTVDFTVRPDGGVSQAYSRLPHTNTPLGKCVANVFVTQGKFRRTRNGLADIRRTVLLRRPDLMNQQ